MIDALLLRFGVPAWVAEIVGVLLLVGAAAAWHTHTVDAAHTAGVAQESTRRDAIDARNTAAAAKELLALNAQVHAAQAELAKARDDLAKLQQENDNGKAVSSQRKSDLAAGHERERVLIHALSTATGNPAPAGSPAGAAPAPVDPGAGIEADLDPRVAGWLEGVRGRHNEAVRRLAACIAEYDAVQKAASAPGPNPGPN